MIGPVVARVLARALSVATVRASIAFGADDGVDRPMPGAAPTAFRIWRAGENATSKGTHTFSRRSAERLMADQSTRGTTYSIDVDHMSLDSSAPPEHHRAVGWHRLEVRETAEGPELWAVDVEWSQEIRAALESQPPGFRYFSPAYDVSRETGEVVAYVNTALTNNPATYQVTALATRAAEEETKMTMKDILAALKAMADGDGDEAKTAARMYKAAEGDDEKKDETEEKKDSEDSDDDEEKKEAKKASDDDSEEKKDSVAATVRSLVQSELQKVRDDGERDRLVASRKDLPEAFISTIKDQPLALVQKVLASMPVQAKKNPAADLTVQATQGNATSSTEPGVGSDVDRALGIRQAPEKAGFAAPVNGLRVLHTMTPSEARSRAGKAG
jgi:hypothetical protein